MADLGKDRRLRSAVLVLAPDPAAVGAARRFVAATCSAGSTTADLRDTAVLLASEAVTNAFIHGRSETRIAVEACLHRVRVEVADGNSRHPKRVEQDAEALDGRGLTIIDLVASGWGVRDDPYGKTVWFEVTD